MHITLIRHAEPEWVRDGLNIDNPPLTDRGHEQAQLLAERLADEHFDEILVSPMLRTMQTAEPLLARMKRPMVIEPWLEEIRNPVWHGTPAERAEAAWQSLRDLSSHERWRGIDGGEAVSDFVDRINVGCSLFLEERGVARTNVDLPVWSPSGAWNEESRIALVAHAGTNSVVICHLLGLAPTPWEWERFVIGHASVSRIDTIRLGDGITFGLTKLSDTEHLPQTMRTLHGGED